MADTAIPIQSSGPREGLAPDLPFKLGRLFHVLIVDDDPLAINFMRAALERPELRIHGATSGESAIRELSTFHPDLVFLDLTLPDMSGIEILDRIVASHSATDVILFTGNYSIDTAVEAIQKGAYDYVTKPVAIDKLRQKIDKWISEAQERERPLDSESLAQFRFHGIVGSSAPMLDSLTRMRRVAPHFQSALICGETGTGKELFARALHELSGASGPFVSCNCAAIVETLFESELFGHARGAFTGATSDKAGMIEHANGGTLFLDEVGELPLPMQAKLLRVLQNREVQRVGSLATKKVDLRVVAATNRDLRSMIATHQFRDDLFYRLSTVEIRVPRLLDRREDFPALEEHFLRVHSMRFSKPAPKISKRARAVLDQYGWPGNIRELENVLSYACMVCEGSVIDIHDLPDWLRNPSSNIADSFELCPLSVLERRHAERVLKHTGGNRVKAANILGISRATLYRLVPNEASAN